MIIGVPKENQKSMKNRVGNDTFKEWPKVGKTRAPGCYPTYSGSK